MNKIFLLFLLVFSPTLHSEEIQKKAEEKPKLKQIIPPQQKCSTNSSVGRYQLSHSFEGEENGSEAYLLDTCTGEIWIIQYPKMSKEELMLWLTK